MSDSSSEEENSEEWVFYKDRPEWKDLKPIPQDDGPTPVVKILYKSKFKDVYDYFRAVIHANEKSERAFNLTKDAIFLNSANYTVWHYRRVLLQVLNKNLHDEMEFVANVIKSHPKNYQVWHHRHVLVDWLRDGSKEKGLTEKILEKDAKNYHAWQHRQWVIKEFNMWDGELEFVEHLLNEDIRNNSAWNQRYFVIKYTTGFTPQVVEREIRFTLDAIAKVTQNESPWNYLRGVLQGRCVEDYPEVIKFCGKLYEDGCRSSQLLAFIVDTLEEKLEACQNSEKFQNQKEALLKEALEILDSLGQKYDVIRKSYWDFLAQNLIMKFATPEEESEERGEGDSNSMT